MRINGFEQIKAFYTIVFNEPQKYKPQHISLYVFLINQNNRNNWVEWFKCPFDLAMVGSAISNKKTYYACLHDLQEWGMLKYEKGVNLWKAPSIRLEVLYDTSTVTSSNTASVPQSEPLLIPLLQQLPTHIYKLITDNYKLVTDNIERWISESKNEKPKKTKSEFNPPTLDEVKTYFKENGYSEQVAEKAFKFYADANWHDSNEKKVKNWKQKMQGVWFREENKSPKTEKQKNDEARAERMKMFN